MKLEQKLWKRIVAATLRDIRPCEYCDSCCDTTEQLDCIRFTGWLLISEYIDVLHENAKEN